MSNLLDTVRSYSRAASYLALEPGRTWLSSLLRLAWARSRYGMGPDNFAFFSRDGKWPKKLGDYVHGRIQVNAFMKRMNRVANFAAVDDKIAFYLRCLRSSLPTPAIVAAVPATGAKQDEAAGSVVVCRTAEELKSQLDRTLLADFFCKPLGGINGKGGFGLRKVQNGFQCGGNVLPIVELFQRIRSDADRFGTMILQERLQVHREMLKISPSGALSTVRVVTCLEDGTVRIVAAILKICAGDNETDNFAKGLTGNLVANIDIESGRLAKAVGSASSEFPLMRSYAEHPDNGYRIEDFLLPDWNDLRALVTAAHFEFSEFWTLGWDIALTDKGPVIIETNPVWATGFLQVAAGKGMRHEFDRWKQRLASKAER
jgi:hypothetical protein